MKLEPGLELYEPWCEVNNESLGQYDIDPLKIESEDNLASYSVQVKSEPPEQNYEDPHSLEVKSGVTKDNEVPLSVQVSETIDHSSKHFLNMPSVTEEFDENHEESLSKEEASEIPTSDINVGVSSSSVDLAFI